MIYEKPMAEIVVFDGENVFMTASQNYSSPTAALNAMCGGYGQNGNDKPNRFSCNSFGGYNASNPPHQGDTVSVGGGTYVFDYVGNHWKLEK